MALQYSNITGNSVETLIAKRKVLNPTTGVNDITFASSTMKTITICNIHATDDVIVDLYIYDATLGTYFILNNVTMYNGATLVLDRNDLVFDNTDYELRIKLNASDSAVDVIIK